MNAQGHEWDKCVWIYPLGDTHDFFCACQRSYLYWSNYLKRRILLSFYLCNQHCWNLSYFFLILGFYNTFINIFWYFHAFKNVHIFFKVMDSQSNSCIYACLLQMLGILFKRVSFISFIKKITCRCPREHRQVLVKVKQTSSVESYF